jgi:outer membrane protein TolC
MEQADGQGARTRRMLRRLAVGACLAGPLMTSGCMQTRPSSVVMARRNAEQASALAPREVVPPAGAKPAAMPGMARTVTSTATPANPLVPVGQQTPPATAGIVRPDASTSAPTNPVGYQTPPAMPGTARTVASTATSATPVVPVGPPTPPATSGIVRPVASTSAPGNPVVPVGYQTSAPTPGVVNGAYQISANAPTKVVQAQYQVPAGAKGPELLPAGVVVGQTGDAAPAAPTAVAAAPHPTNAATYGPATSITHLPGDQPEPVSTPPIAMPNGAAKPVAPAMPAVLPVGLDTVLRLAEDQNLQVGIAREKVRAAYADRDIANSRWLPDVWVGTAYYRHEGGIQDFTGQLVKSSYGSMFAGMEMNSQFDVREYAYQKLTAQRQVWQQKGDLVKVTTETTMEAANTYLDLLTARTGEAVAREMENDVKELLKRAESLAAKEPAANVEVTRIRAELMGQQQVIAKLHQQAEAASAKLAYLLGVDPCTEMLPVDGKLMPLELVDASPPTCELVAQALSTGPGIQEMEGLLSLVNEAMEHAQGLSKFMPVVGMRMAEGAFGAGPGSSSSWDNRFDLGLQARWNLTEYCTACERRRAALAKMQQAHLAYQDLRAKLTAGVQASRSEIQGGREQIRLGRQQIDDSKSAHKMSFDRLKLNVQGASHSEVLLAIRSVGLAQLNYLTAINAYNKAQVRLMVLLGPNAPECRPLPVAEVQ